MSIRVLKYLGTVILFNIITDQLVVCLAMLSWYLLLIVIGIHVFVICFSFRVCAFSKSTFLLWKYDSAWNKWFIPSKSDLIDHWSMTIIVNIIFKLFETTAIPSNDRKKIEYYLKKKKNAWNELITWNFSAGLSFIRKIESGFRWIVACLLKNILNDLNILKAFLFLWNSWWILPFSLELNSCGSNIDPSERAFRTTIFHTIIISR